MVGYRNLYLPGQIQFEEKHLEMIHVLIVFKPWINMNLGRKCRKQQNIRHNLIDRLKSDS